MPSLWDPMQIGPCALKHRVVMAPMTRLRADAHHVPSDMMVEYYRQRASVPGTLLITEATFVSAAARGRDEHAPGVYAAAQVAGWRRISDAVHRQGSFVFMQLWHVGRAARPRALQAAGLEMVSSSARAISAAHGAPRAMSAREIEAAVRSFADAARNAVAAGCDGVEIHGANGYLVDQFIQDVCNCRDDQWGGSVANRSRFCVEVVRAVAAAIGPQRTALRLSPFSTFQGMGMADPVPQFSHLISQLAGFGLAYLHLIEPRVAGNVDCDPAERQSLDFALKAWNKSGPLILAGGYKPDTTDHELRTRLKDEDVAVAFGRYFISNPDLPCRIKLGKSLTSYNRETFYTVQSTVGYTDYVPSESCA